MNQETRKDQAEKTEVTTIFRQWAEVLVNLPNKLRCRLMIILAILMIALPNTGMLLPDEKNFPHAKIVELNGEETLEEIAKIFMPKFYFYISQFDPKRDIPVSPFFDGDKNLANNVKNWESTPEQKLKPVVYYRAIKLSSGHYLITYFFYYPQDKRLYPQLACDHIEQLGCHPHDLETVTILVGRNRLTSQAHVEAVILAPHDELEIYFTDAEEDQQQIPFGEDGNTEIFIQPGGHGLGVYPPPLGMQFSSLRAVMEGDKLRIADSRFLSTEIKNPRVFIQRRGRPPQAFAGGDPDGSGANPPWEQKVNLDDLDEIVEKLKNAGYKDTLGYEVNRSWYN